MKFSAKDYAKALIESITDTNPKDTDKILDNFVKVLAENNDIRMFDQIAEEFHKLELEKKGIKQAVVTSAHSINSDNEKLILKELNNIAKGNIEIKKKVDEQLIGGVVIQMEDQLLDASVKNNLEQLKKELSK